MGDKHRVRFEPVGIEIEVDEDQTILRAAFEQGVQLMHAVSYTHLTLPTNREV